MTKLLLTIPEAMAALSLGRTSIYELSAAGMLDARKTGKRIVITAESVERYAAGLPPARLKPYRRPSTRTAELAAS